MSIDLVSKEEAFKPVEGERNLPIDFTQYDYQITRKWFQYRNQKTWSTFLFPKFRARRRSRKPIRMIQIGVFEGMDLVWCLQHILQHPDSCVVAIDPWEATRKLDQDEMNSVKKRAENNLSPWRKKIKLVQGYSQDVLQEMVRTRTEVAGQKVPAEQWDLIIIDGDHQADAVVRDAELSLLLAKPGCWLVFDDVRNKLYKKDHVAQGLQKFLPEHEDEVKFEWAHRYCNCYSVKETRHE